MFLTVSYNEEYADIKQVLYVVPNKPMKSVIEIALEYNVYSDPFVGLKPVPYLTFTCDRIIKRYYFGLGWKTSLKIL